MIDIRPLHYLPDIEIRAWMRRPWNKRFRMYWHDMAPTMKSRFGSRSVSMKVFALGYLAGQRSIRDEVEKFPEAIELSSMKLTNELLNRLEKATRLSKVD